MSSKTIGFFVGITAFLVLILLPTPAAFQSAATQFLSNGPSSMTSDQLAYAMKVVLALLLLMISWWITEAIPLPATALLPPVVLPWFHLSGIQAGHAQDLTLKTILANYANPVIYLFLGGFLIAGAMQKWRLDRRFTLWLLTRGKLANDSRSVLLSLMAVTAILSMWISNTATAAMMLPLGLGILSLMRSPSGSSRFGTAVMLGIAWAASIGGVGTIIGTPPNGIGLGILNTVFAHDPTYHRITFLKWMMFGVPYVIIFVPVAWFLILRFYPPEFITVPGGKERLLAERAELSSISTPERRTIGAFLLAVVLWVSNPFWPQLLPGTLAAQLGWIDEYTIGLVVGTLLFIIPVNIKEATFLLEWQDIRYVDWGTLLLFGGGIALSDAMFKTGLASWLAISFVELFGSPSSLALLFLTIVLVALLTEVTSNTAVTSMAIPIVISIAQRLGHDPILLALGATVAASMAFMLPVATPPNALVYGTGQVKIKEMVRAGFALDIAGAILTTLLVTLLARQVLR
jgi:sodium-dependent dicarboxylate transporter 2/3/5